jgi:hypothetical protein
LAHLFTAVCINLGTRVIFCSKFSAGISISEKGNLVQLATDTAQMLTLELYQHQQVAWTEESLKNVQETRAAAAAQVATQGGFSDTPKFSAQITLFLFT